MKELQLGAHIGVQEMPFSDLRGLWRELDEGGLDWISIWDHIYEVPPQGGTQPHFESLTTLGALCADTTHARIGTLVFYVGYRNPAYLAKAATTLDHISGGRFELGIGAGWAEEEANAYGYEFPALGTRMNWVEDALALIKAMVTNERTTHQGEFYGVEDAANLPQPVRGRIPIWIGGTGRKRTPRIAAEHADGWNAPYVSPATFRELSQAVDAACERIGRDPAEIERSVNLAFSMVSDAAVLKRTEEALHIRLGDMADQFVEGTLLCTPDQATERLMEYVDAGAQGINVALRAPLDRESISAYVEQVVPEVRAAVG